MITALIHRVLSVVNHKTRQVFSFLQWPLSESVDQCSEHCTDLKTQYRIRYLMQYCIQYSIQYYLQYCLQCCMQYCIQYCIQYRTSAISCFRGDLLASKLRNRKSPIFCFCLLGLGFLADTAWEQQRARETRIPFPFRQNKKSAISCLQIRQPTSRRRNRKSQMFCTE